MSTSRVLRFLDSTFWAMYPPAYETMRAVIESWAGLPHAMPRLSPAEQEAAVLAAQADRPSQVYTSPSSIAVINMFGIIAPRTSMIEMSQEGCPLDMWSAKYRRALSDPDIGAIAVNSDGPGGSVFQVQETGDLIYGTRGQKPVVCVVTGMSASATFWINSQFPELVASPSSQLGSIGVLMRHEDISKMAEDAGVKMTYISSPRGGNKAEGNPFTPLSDETEEYYNAQCDEYYSSFLAALARGRSVKARTIDQDWGRGRMVGAQTALKLGMVDRISTLQAEIDKLAIALSKQKGKMRAEQEQELTAFMAGVEERQAQEEATILAERAALVEEAAEAERVAAARARLSLLGV